MKQRLAGALLLAGIGFGGWLVWRANSVPKAVYTPAGYGGFRSAAGAGPGEKASAPSAPSRAADPVAPALVAYNRGRFTEAERAAQQLLVGERAGPSRETARARWVLAFSAARRHDLAAARQRFAELRRAAAGQPWTLEAPRSAPAPQPGTRNPERGTHSPEPGTQAPELPPDRPVSSTGEPLPTLEEEAAYQHAVLTAALATSPPPASAIAKPGTRNLELGTRNAEAEFLAFMRHYPESPLVHAAVRRIARLHGGNVPPEAEGVWKEAVAAAQHRQHTRDRARSLCGPELLREVLRRSGADSAAPEAAAGPGSLSLEALARELGTDHQGTTLAALAQAGEKHGFQARGLRLTWDGLWQITNGPEGRRHAPAFLIALVRPGHYVLVEDVRAGEVEVWDPSGQGPDQPGTRRYPRPDWLRLWSGALLRLDRPTG